MWVDLANILFWIDLFYQNKKQHRKIDLGQCRFQRAGGNVRTASRGLTGGREGGTILYHVHLDTFVLFSSSVNLEDNHTTEIQVTNAFKLKFQ